MDRSERAALESTLLQLPGAERARLGALLIASLDDPAPVDQARVDEAWSREIEARVRAYRAGSLRTYSVEEVFAESEALLADAGDDDSDDP